MSTTSNASRSETLIVFGTPSTLRLQDASEGWIYLGKQDRLGALTTALGRPPLSLGKRLHLHSHRLRRPFLDLVAELGSRERDASPWWAGTLAWKNPAASDLFLLCCYQALCMELATENKPFGAKRLAVVIEDDWLLSQLKINLHGKEAVEFRGNSRLAVTRLAAAGLGTARRLKWLARMLLSRLRQSWYSRGRKTSLGAPRQVLIYSHLLPRSLVGQWTEHYLTGLDEELTTANFKVVRVADTDVTGFEAAVAERSDAVVPLILLASPAAFLRALTALPPPARAASLDGAEIALLLRREWWHDISRAGRCAYLLLEDCLNELFSRATFEACVYPWENQPQERMLLLAARRAGLRTVGCQHTTLPGLMLHLFPGREEVNWAPLPDRLLACGSYPLEKLRDEGMPAGRLLLGGSRRYPPTAALSRPPSSTDVLALLPLDSDQSRKLLAAMRRVERASKNEFRIKVKAHPATGLKRADFGFLAEAVDGPLDAVLERCGAVVFTGTTSGIEAWLSGHPVLRFRSDSLLDTDPCDMLSDSELPTADDWNLPEELAQLRARPRPPGELTRRALENLFAPVDKELWLSAIRGTC